MAIRGMSDKEYEQMFAMLGAGENERAKGIKVDNEMTKADYDASRSSMVEREIWNAAIEAAVKQCDEMGEEERISYNLRTLKK